MNNNIGFMSSDNVDALFDGMMAGAKQTQQVYQQTVNAFQPQPASQQSNMYEPRRTDGFYPQFQSQYPSNGYGASQQPAPRQTYGYGYTETFYGGTTMFGQTASTTQQEPMYNGFYNPAYGK